ncbi:MAG: M14 family zinc carboxypeptidase [Chlamydiota bacterium]
MEEHLWGYSASGRQIKAYRHGRGEPNILIIGGVHGDEHESIVASRALQEHYYQYPPKMGAVTIVPEYNPDGVAENRRSNSRGIDLNRNLPTKDWKAEVAHPRYHPGPYPGSEPESEALVQYLKNYDTSWIISLHSWNPVLNVNGECSLEARLLQQYVGYKIVDDIGYPTPGCLGTYAGLERAIPTLTYEIERGLDGDKILNVHLPAIISAINFHQEKYYDS